MQLQDHFKPDLVFSNSGLLQFYKKADGEITKFTFT
jgi:hypothetical protein